MLSQNLSLMFRHGTHIFEVLLRIVGNVVKTAKARSLLKE